MTYQVELSPSARRQLGKFSQEVQILIIRRLRTLRTVPYPKDSVKMHGQQEGYRIRVGDYRIIYRVFKSRLQVYVIRIAHRREAYRRLGRG